MHNCSETIVAEAATIVTTKLFDYLESKSSN